MESSSAPVRRAFKETVALPGPSAVDATVFAQNSFFFQQRRGKLDMRSLARVDVERVIEEVDVGTLQMHLENLTFSDLCTDDMVAYTDEHFLKLFRLSQLTIEYLLNVQNALLTYSRSCEDEAEKLKNAAAEGERRLRSRHKKVNSLKRSLKQQRQTIKTYEALLKQHQQVAASSPPRQHYNNSVAASPGSDVLMAEDGRQFVSVDYLKRKAVTAASMKAGEAASASQREARAAEQARIKRLEEQQIQRDKEWAKKMEDMMAATKNAAAEGRASDDLAKLNAELMAEKQRRKDLEARMSEARISHEDQVARMQESVQEEIRKMKQLMQAELSDQRSIQQQELAAMALSGASSVQATVTSAAGDLVSDSEDELHDRESMGQMRRSKREMAKMLAENQAKLEVLERQKLAMRDRLIEQFVRRRQTIKIGACFNCWRSDVFASKASRSFETQKVSEKVQDTQEPPVAPAPLPKPTPKAKPSRDGKLYIPTYKWTKLPPTASLPFQDQLEIVERTSKDGSDTYEEVRIPATWELPLTLERQSNKGGDITIAVQVLRSQLVSEVLERAASHLEAAGAGKYTTDEAPGSICFFAQAQHGGHILHVSPSSTVESENLFVKRPLLRVFSGVSDAAVQKLVEKYVAYKDKRIAKSKKPLKRDEREMMELQDQVVVEALTEKGLWSDDHIASLVKNQPLSRHETTEFASVESLMYHTIDEIGEESAETMSLLEIELELSNLKRTRGNTKDDKKKRVRSMTKKELKRLMERGSWHLKGENWPASKQDTTMAEEYLKRCLTEEDAGRNEEVAVKMLAHREESDMQSNSRLERLKKLLSETSKRSKLGPKARKVEIKKLLHKIHGHYFHKLFNMLQNSDSSTGATQGIPTSETLATGMAPPTVDEVDAMAAELAAEDDDSLSDAGSGDEVPVPERQISVNAGSVNSRDGSSEPHVQEVMEDPSSPVRPVVPRRSGIMGNANLLRQSAVVDYTGEDQTLETAETPASMPVEQDDLNYSNWDDEEDNGNDDIGGERKTPQTRELVSESSNAVLDANADSLNDSMESVLSFDASAAADRYERQAGETRRSPEKAAHNAASAISAVRREGASPGNRRGRSSGGELEVDEFGNDSMDLDGSWDM